MDRKKILDALEGTTDYVVVDCIVYIETEETKRERETLRVAEKIAELQQKLEDAYRLIDDILLSNL